MEITVTPLDNPKYLPRPEKVIEYTGSLEEACKQYLAKFHSLPDVVYQYQYRFFFPLTKNEE